VTRRLLAALLLSLSTSTVVVACAPPVCDEEQRCDADNADPRVRDEDCLIPSGCAGAACDTSVELGSCTGTGCQ